MTRSTLISLLKRTALKWSQHNAPSLGASLAFYALLSLAPLAVLIVAIASFFLTQAEAKQDLIGQARELAGTAAADSLRSIINSTHHSGGGMMASTLAIVTLFFGASGVFVELRQSLNIIWDAPPESSGVRSFLKQRLVTFFMVIMLGILILLSLLTSTGIGLAEHYFVQLVPAGTAFLSQVLNVVVSLLALAILFALIFKFVPDVQVEWREVGVGALATAVLFTVGRGLLSLYLSTAGIGSTYGAAGSLVVMVVWVYYSAQIFFFGAIFTRVYADQQRLHPNLKATAAIK